MGEFSITHWLIILAIVLIFMGPSKLPALGKSLGEAIRGFKKGLNTDSPESHDANRQISHSPNEKGDTVGEKATDKNKA